MTAMSASALRRAGRRFRRLSWAERALFTEAVACLAVTRLVVRSLPFARIAPRLGVRMAESSDDTPVDADVRRIAWAIAAVGRRTPWRSGCMEQAIAAKAMLRRREVPSTMYLGVAQAPFEAHAWLRVGRETVLGGHGAERFAIIASFAEPSPPGVVDEAASRRVPVDDAGLEPASALSRRKGTA